MSRKHFEAIAKAIRENNMSKDHKVILAESLRESFSQANRAFNYSRFLDACLGE